MKIAVSFKAIQGGSRRRAGFVFGNRPVLIEVNDEQLKAIQDDKYLTIHPVESSNFMEAKQDAEIQEIKKETIVKDNKRKAKKISD